MSPSSITITLPDSSHNGYDSSDNGTSWISFPYRFRFLCAFITTRHNPN